MIGCGAASGSFERIMGTQGLAKWPLSHPVRSATATAATAAAAARGEKRAAAGSLESARSRSYEALKTVPRPLFTPAALSESSSRYFKAVPARTSSESGSSIAELGDRGPPRFAFVPPIVRSGCRGPSALPLSKCLPPRDAHPPLSSFLAIPPVPFRRRRGCSPPPSFLILLPSVSPLSLPLLLSRCAPSS